MGKGTGKGAARCKTHGARITCGGSGHAKDILKRSQEDGGDRKKKKRLKTEKKKKKADEKKKQELRIRSLQNYGSSLFPLLTGTAVNVIDEVLLREITIADGLHLIGGGAGANSLPTMIPHAQGTNPAPFTVGTTFSYLIPITTTAMFEAIPIGGHLYTYWESVGWPHGSYLARRVS